MDNNNKIMTTEERKEERTSSENAYNYAQAFQTQPPTM